MDNIDGRAHGVLAGFTIVFDLDGTLIDTAPDLVAALNVCLSDAGFAPVPAPIVQGQIGLGSVAMIEAGLAFQNADLDTAEIDQLRSVFLDHYAANTANRSRPYPGVLAALDRLEDAGATLAICTNKPQGLADTLLGELDIAHRFKAVIGSDSVPNRKPHPDHILQTLDLAGGDHSRAIMVGDSDPDEKAAQRAGLPFIFVPFGYGPIGTAQNKRLELEDYSKLTSEFILNLF